MESSTRHCPVTTLAKCPLEPLIGGSDRELALLNWSTSLSSPRHLMVCTLVLANMRTCFWENDAHIWGNGGAFDPWTGPSYKDRREAPLV
ncbi:hypothetical protein D5086_001964 [Populus alba]|uniref:Uncharacterized protein n=1 Tax=Populus alba TaxID=43335 RepID=A0ACC4D1M5_POPAL